MSDGPRVAYIWSQELQDVADQLPANIGRSSMVHSLIRSLDLLEESQNPVSAPSPAESESPDEDQRVLFQRYSFQPGRAIVIPPNLSLGTAEWLSRYHNQEYVEYLLSKTSEDASDDEQRGSGDSDSDTSLNQRTSRKKRRKQHGLEHDCPHFAALPTYARFVAAATQTACRLVARGQADITICWDGGRHHALRNKASGFCYVADIVLGIMLLSKEGTAIPRPLPNGVSKISRRPRIMYIDLDLHYGDGVASAFHSPTHYPFPLPKRIPRPPQVLTLSIHHSSPIFFPPKTPLSALPPPDTPHPFSLSIPLAAYPSPKTYQTIWESVEKVQAAFQPDYVVLQLGADGLPGDSIGQYGAWNVDGHGGMLWCLEKVKAWGKGLIVLGGGGYDHANTARAWARVTASIAGKGLNKDTDVPHHDYFPDYAPSYTLEVSKSNAKDENSLEDLTLINETFSTIASRIQDIVVAHA